VDEAVRDQFPIYAEKELDGGRTVSVVVEDFVAADDIVDAVVAALNKWMKTEEYDD
jgi:hypothetical protein